MKSIRSNMCFSAFLLLVVVLLLTTSCLGCAAIGRRPVRVADESAIIVWNPITHIEHFIRSAAFETAEHDFAFVVPTPSRPKLQEADPAALPYLTNLCFPELHGDTTVVQPWSIWTSLVITKSRSKARLAAHMLFRQDVDIISHQEIAGLDSTTLAASDVVALGRWMKLHKYPWNHDQAEWLKPYVDNRWDITVFRYVKPQSSQGLVSSSLLDMSFKTAAPFFPYSEPANQRQKGSFSHRRLLRVFILSDARMRGDFASDSINQDWPGMTTFAAPFADRKLAALLKQLKLTPHDFPANTWLTTLEDRSTPRPGIADVEFTTDDDQSKIVPPPADLRKFHYIYIPVEAVLALLIGLTLWLNKRRFQTSLVSVVHQVVRGTVWALLGLYVAMALLTITMMFTPIASLLVVLVAVSIARLTTNRSRNP